MRSLGPRSAAWSWSRAGLSQELRIRGMTCTDGAPGVIASAPVAWWPRPLRRFGGGGGRGRGGGYGPGPGYRGGGPPPQQRHNGPGGGYSPDRGGRSDDSASSSSSGESGGLPWSETRCLSAPKRFRPPVGWWSGWVERWKATAFSMRVLWALRLLGCANGRFAPQAVVPRSTCTPASNDGGSAGSSRGVCRGPLGTLPFPPVALLSNDSLHLNSNRHWPSSCLTLGLLLVLGPCRPRPAATPRLRTARRGRRPRPRAGCQRRRRRGPSRRGAACARGHLGAGAGGAAGGSRGGPEEARVRQ